MVAKIIFLNETAPSVENRPLPTNYLYFKIFPDVLIVYTSLENYLNAFTRNKYIRTVFQGFFKIPVTNYFLYFSMYFERAAM